MAKINAYKFTLRNVFDYEEIWNSEEKKITPIKSLEMVAMYMVLDSITNAVEAGVVDTLTWPQQFFATKNVFIEFIQQLAGYDDCFRISDQWWQALAFLADVSDEEGFISTQDIADELFAAVEKDGLLNNWGKKKPTYKYTEAQYEEAQFQSVVDSVSNGRLGLSFEQRTAMNDVLRFGGRHFSGLALSKARYQQAEAEGLALRKKVTAKKSQVAKNKQAAKKKAK